MARLQAPLREETSPQGRPALPPHERRSLVVEVAVNEQERARLASLASARGLPLAVYLRELGLGLPLPRATAAASMDAQRLDAFNKLWLASSALRRELAPLGNNLNQLAHHANAGRYQSASVDLLLREVAPLVERLKRLETEAARLLTASTEDAL